MCHADTTSNLRPNEAANAIKGDWVEIHREDVEMPVFVARPQQPTGAGIVIIHDIYGASIFYQDMARRLAAEGYLVAVPNLFARYGELEGHDFTQARARSSKMWDATVMTDLDATVSYLKQQGAKRIDTIGFCMGGRYALLFAEHSDQLSGSVVYYGFPTTREPSERQPESPMDHLDKINAPILGQYGSADGGIPVALVDELATKLDNLGKPREIHIYQGAPHGFLTFDTSNPQYANSKLSWERTLDFLRRTLRPEGQK